MSHHNRLPLTRVEPCAEDLVERLRPYCERIEIAGSIRRGVAYVGDVELVVIPRVEQGGQRDLFEAVLPGRNLLAEEITRIAAEKTREIVVLKPGTKDWVPWRINPEGRYWRLVFRLPNDGSVFPLDVFLQTPETWGLNLMIRTGSGVGPDGVPEHGFVPAMLRRWKALSGGGESRGAQLYDGRGQLHPTPEEADVFRVLRVPWLEPHLRTSHRAVPEVGRG